MKAYVPSTSLSVFSMVEACVSSVSYVLLWVTSLSQRKDETKASELCLMPLVYLYEKNVSGVV